jgi:SAM-dependent methyltransferase
VDVTNRYVLHFAAQAAPPPAEVLDFGCGAGDVVAAGREAGLRIRGADVFYTGSDARAQAEAAGRMGTVVFEIREGRLPFADSEFDLVVNNQVMEHVEDLDAELRELRRVLKPGGMLLSIFPSREVLREGHIGIPLSHRLLRGSGFRFAYTYALRCLGFGTWKRQNATRSDWVREKLAWIDEYTRYRPQREILAAYGRYFSNRLCEPDYIRFRLRDKAWRAPLARVLDIPGVPVAASALFRRLAFLVIVSRKEQR